MKAPEPTHECFFTANLLRIVTARRFDANKALSLLFLFALSQRALAFVSREKVQSEYAQLMEKDQRHSYRTDISDHKRPAQVGKALDLARFKLLLPLLRFQAPSRKQSNEKSPCGEQIVGG